MNRHNACPKSGSKRCYMVSSAIKWRDCQNQVKYLNEEREVSRSVYITTPLPNSETRQLLTYRVVSICVRSCTEQIRTSFCAFLVGASEFDLSLNLHNESYSSSTKICHIQPIHLSETTLTRCLKNTNRDPEKTFLNHIPTTCSE